jgi:hypothetical protein
MRLVKESRYVEEYPENRGKACFSIQDKASMKSMTGRSPACDAMADIINKCFEDEYCIDDYMWVINLSDIKDFKDTYKDAKKALTSAVKPLFASGTNKENIVNSTLANTLSPAQSTALCRLSRVVSIEKENEVDQER